MSDDPPKTTKEMVTDALTNVLTDMWKKNHPYDDPETYTADFQRFCERQLFFALKLKSKAKETTNE